MTIFTTIRGNLGAEVLAGGKYSLLLNFIEYQRPHPGFKLREPLGRR